MRIVKMSGEVFGFDNIDSCKSYFEHVLTWQKGNFYFAGEGNKIAKDKLSEGENVLFLFEGKVVSIAKVKKLIITDGKKVNGITIDVDTLKIFKKPIVASTLEIELRKYGYNESIYGSQGWNIIEGNIEKKAIEFLKNKEWEIY